MQNRREPEPHDESHPPDPEMFWSRLLSADPDQMRRALEPLTEDQRLAIERHLRRMSTEPGWQDGQRRRALAALEAMQRFHPSEDE